MQFRWIAIIAVWTLLAGPMFNSRWGDPKRQPLQTTAAHQLQK